MNVVTNIATLPYSRVTSDVSPRLLKQNDSTILLYTNLLIRVLDFCYRGTTDDTGISYGSVWVRVFGVSFSATFSPTPNSVFSTTVTVSKKDVTFSAFNPYFWTDQ